jgi:hypothetical protein
MSYKNRRSFSGQNIHFLLEAQKCDTNPVTLLTVKNPVIYFIFKSSLFINKKPWLLDSSKNRNATPPKRSGFKIGLETFPRIITVFQIQKKRSTNFREKSSQNFSYAKQKHK